MNAYKIYCLPLFLLNINGFFPGKADNSTFISMNMYNNSSPHILSKRQISLSTDPHVRAWRRIYFFSIKLSKALGNNALVWNLNDMMQYNMGEARRAYTYGYRSRGGGGCGCGCGGGSRRGAYYGGYGGYSAGAAATMTYAMQPVYYTVSTADTGIQQEVIPIDGINGFTNNFGTAISNSDLLDQLIAIIQDAIGSSYTYYYSNGGDQQGATDAGPN